MGYAVECALKACVAKQVRRYDFPDKNLANAAHVHDLERLVGVAELRPALERDAGANKPLALNWALVKDWSEASRYDIGITEAQARDFHSACAARKNGILPWTKRRW